MRKLLPFILCLGFVIVAESQDKGHFPSVATKSAPITLLPDQLKAVQADYQAARTLELAYNVAQQVLVDKTNACESTVLDRLKDKFEKQNLAFSNRILQARIELNVPKDFTFNVETGQFAAPAPPAK